VSEKEMREERGDENIEGMEWWCVDEYQINICWEGKTNEHLSK
jgi:hypothetical protein